MKHTKKWQLQTAKARFSELFRKTREEGPQWVTRQGKESVVVISSEEFERLRKRNRAKDLVQFFAESPLVGLEIKVERRIDPERNVDL